MIFCKSREFYVAFLTGKLSFDVEREMLSIVRL